MPVPSEPRWQDLSPTHQEELLRLLGRMLTDRLAGEGEVTDDCH